MPQRPISMTCRVLSVVSHSEEPLKAWQVARSLGCPCNGIRVLLGRLVDRGDIQRVERDGGVYFWLTHSRDTSGPHVWDIFGVR